MKNEMTQEIIQHWKNDHLDGKNMKQILPTETFLKLKSLTQIVY